MNDVYTIQEAATALRAGEISSAELIRAALTAADALDDALGVYITRFDEQALAAAAKADTERAAGIDRGPLHGVPVGVKDVIAAREARTSAQSLVVRPGWEAGRDAVVVAHLRQAGAIIMGKTTTHEFACGFPEETKPFPFPRNPWNLGCWPGGSSSGSAVGVATGLFAGALGTDSGGSIRTPAALSGVTGLKPTYSLVPTDGTIALGDTVDHVGPLTHSAWDAAAMLDVLSARSSQGSSFVAALDRPRATKLDGLRVGVARAWHFLGDEDPAIVAAFDAAVRQLTDLGATVTDVELPLYNEASAAAYVILNCESGARHHHDLQHHWDDYTTSSRDLLGWSVLLTAADYVQAQRVRTLARQAAAMCFADIDIVVSPTTTIGAPTHAEIEAGGFAALAGRGHMGYWSVLGNPAVTVQMGFTSVGMPIGMQLSGRPFEDGTVLRVGHAFQSVTDWHRCHPDVAALAAGK